MAEYLIVNGAAYDHASSEVRMLGKPRRGVSEIEYEHEREVGELRANHQQALAETDGDYKPTVKITMARGLAEQIRDELGDGYMDKRWPLGVSYVKEGLKLINDDIPHCKITKESFSSKTGSDAQMVTWELHTFYIKPNGKKPLKNLIEG
jgi:hypothetical protein